MKGNTFEMLRWWLLGSEWVFVLLYSVSQQVTWAIIGQQDCGHIL